MRCNEIGIGISKDEFVGYLNSVKGGQYFSVRGYVNADGEMSDQILRFGIKYGSIKERDVTLLRSILGGKQMPDLSVTQGVWIPPAKLESVDALFSAAGEHDVWTTVKHDHDLPDGTTIRVTKTGHANLLDVETFGNKRGNKKDGYNVQATISYSLPCTHPLVVAAIGDADLQGTVLQGLLQPREATTDYDKVAQSAYSLEKDGQTKWYLRDVLAVHKVVRVEGDYGFSASLPINAVKRAIQSQWLLTGKYRQFVLTSGQFESVTIEGQAVLCDGTDEQFYFALPETVKEVAIAEASG